MRIETEAEGGSEAPFSHDVSERLVTKYDETTAASMAPSGGSGGIEQPLPTPRRRTFSTPLPRRRPSPGAAGPDPMTTPFDHNVTARGERTQQIARQAPESAGDQDQLASLAVLAATRGNGGSDGTPCRSRTGSGSRSPNDGRTPSGSERNGGHPLQALSVPVMDAAQLPRGTTRI
jgi:hypothetical protein